MGSCIECQNQISNGSVLEPQHQQNKRQLFHSEEGIFNIQRDNQSNKSNKNNSTAQKIIEDETIDKSDIERKMAEAIKLMQNDPQSSIRVFEQISLSIMKSNDRSFSLMEKYAYAQSQLAYLCILTNNDNYIHHEKFALSIYRKVQTDYYQEIITLLNNVAVKLEKQQKFDESIERYRLIVSLQDMYLCNNDPRRLLAHNNLACLLFQKGDRDQGEQEFKKLKDKIAKQKIDEEIATLIKKNYDYYHRS